MTDYVFVYGSLKQDESHHHLLEPFATLTCKTSVQGILYRVVDYPGLVLTNDPGQRVTGEIYEIHDTRSFDLMDEWEGCRPQDPQPHHYRRDKVEIPTPMGTFSCWLYVYIQPTDTLPVINSGNWTESNQPI